MLWVDEIRSHPIESKRNHCLWVFTGESSFSSTHSIKCQALCLSLGGHRSTGRLLGSAAGRPTRFRGIRQWAQCAYFRASAAD